MGGLSEMQGSQEESNGRLFSAFSYFHTSGS